MGIRLKKLNTKGFSHHLILPVIAVVVVAGIGAYVVTQSKAATSPKSVAFYSNSLHIEQQGSQARDNGRKVIKLEDKGLVTVNTDKSAPLRSFIQSNHNKKIQVCANLRTTNVGKADSVQLRTYRLTTNKNFALNWTFKPKAKYAQQCYGATMITKGEYNNPTNKNAGRPSVSVLNTSHTVVYLENITISVQK